MTIRILLAALAAAPLSVVPSVATAQAAATPSPEAMTLAQRVQPEDLYLETAEPGFLLGLRLAVANEETMPEGVDSGAYIADLHAQAWPIFREELRARLPELQRELAIMYDAKLATHEMVSYADFLAGSTGRKFLAASMQSLSMDDVEALIRQNGTISQEQLMQLSAGAGMRAAQSMSAEEQAEIAAFEADNLDALMRVAPEAAAISQRFAMAPPSEATQKAIAAQIKQAKARHGL